jgi:hypothetical protein
VALRKPSDIFDKKIEDINIPVVESDSSLYLELSKVESLSEQVSQLQQELSQKVIQTDLEKLVLSQINSMRENFNYLQNDFKKSNKKDISEFKDRVSQLTEIVGNLVEEEIPKYKKQVTKNEVRIGEKFDTLKEVVEENIVDIRGEIDTQVNNIAEVIDNNLEYFNNQLQETSSKVKDTTDTYNKLSKILENKLVKENEKLEEYSQIIQSLHEEFVELQSLLEEKTLSYDQVIQEKFGDISSDINKKIRSIDEEVDTFKNKVSSEISNIKADVVINEQHIKNVDKYLKENHSELIELKEEVFGEIEKLPIGNLQENLERLEKKIDFIKETYSRIEPEVIVKEVIREGLLNEPPDTKNSDPLTPLDQKFVTLEQLQEHYRLFINRIQQQLSTLGGGGETRLKYLDDIVGIATNPSAYDGKFLKYNHSIGKFEFDAVSGGGGDYASVAGIATYAITAGIATYATYSGIATTATYLADAANIITGVIDRNRINTTSALSVVGDLYVSGNISFGGTTTQLNTEQLQIADSDIILGIGTSFSPTDNTANHGGIAIASTEGTPLVNLNIIPSEILPPTYKKIMWFKGNTIGAGITDAWLFNYGVGIGSTQVPNGVRLAVGGVHITDTTISANSYSGSGTNLTGIVTSIIAGVGITVTSSTGQVTVSSSDPVLQNPIFTYTGGVLTSILYSSGATKTFTYTTGILTQIDLVVGSRTFRKTFNYTAGILTSITETEF